MQEEVKVALWEIGSALTWIEAASRRDQRKRYREARERELKARMAEVNHQLLSAHNKEDTGQQFLDNGTSNKQLEGAIKEEMEERSHKARSGACATDVDAQEHNVLHHQFCAWVRVTKRDNIEHKILIFCAPARQRTVKLVVDSLLVVKIPQGSPHKQVEALVVAIVVAIWRLQTVGADREIFIRSGTIASLVSKLEEGTQTKWYLYLTKDSEKSEEEALIQWLQINEAAGEIWRQQRIISAWFNAEREHQNGDRVSKLINNQERRKRQRRKPKSRKVTASGSQER